MGRPPKAGRFFPGRGEERCKRTPPAGELEGAAARLEWDGAPRRALPCKARAARAAGAFGRQSRPKATALVLLFKARGYGQQKRLRREDSRRRRPDNRKASQSLRPQARKNENLFSAATCAWAKTLLKAQTCEPSAFGGRFVRCSALPAFRRKRQGLFRRLRGTSVPLKKFSSSACAGSGSWCRPAWS